MYAKELLAEQPYLFWLLAMIAAVACFLRTRRPRYAFFAMVAGFVALMLRNEALYLVVLAYLIMVGLACRDWRRMSVLALSGGTVVGQ